MERGRILNSPLFSLRISPIISSTSHFSVVVSKKDGKTAVIRNKIKRKLYSAIYKMMPNTKHGFALVFYAKNAVVSTSPADLSRELEKLFKNAGVLV